MKLHIISFLLLFTVESDCSTDNRFFISAPNVFRMGVKEKVFVQLGKRHLNNLVTLYLEHESNGVIVSEKKTTSCNDEKDTKTVELMINRQIMTRFKGTRYLLLVAESPTFPVRKSTRVLVSEHRGYIFIQTDQPIYKPKDEVKYRVFTLDHTFRPHEEVFHLSIYNAAGNRIMKSLKTAKGGIFKSTFTIPDVAKMGTWNITAHYEGDEANAVSREFKVKKFILPSFEVNIAMEQNYILLSAEQFVFTISAKYSYGEKVTGAYHCQIGMVNKTTTHGQEVTPVFIKDLEQTGSVKNETATVSLSPAKIDKQLKDHHNRTLSDLQQSGAQLYLGVYFTDIQSGQIQKAEAYLPIISHKYTMDLSRTRSHFVPGYPLDVVVVMHLPDGSPAAGVEVKTDVQASTEKSLRGITDQDGTAFFLFNIQSVSQITIDVTADDLQQRKVLRSITSSSNSYLYLSFTNKVYSVNELLSITYNTMNGPGAGFIYYMVLSRGILIKQGHLTFGSSVKDNLPITSDMVPSFRLIGYFYNQQGNIIADSVWVDVRDECGINVKVEHKGRYEPGRQATLDFDLHDQSATVAILGVDKAMYGLKADNKLTAKQVFSTMQSYDLGCSYGGGADSASILVDAGLSFVSHTQSAGRKGFGCDSQSARQRRDVDLQEEMMVLKSNFSNEKLQECCVRGFSPIPMRLTCQERAKRVFDPACADTFLTCCLQGERLRKQKIQENIQKEFSRSASIDDIEHFFLDPAAQYIRRYFPPSFAFKEFQVNGKKSYTFTLPDSITTWEIQVLTLSPATGFCVVKPTEVKAFKKTFVSLRLPYSVRKYEQLSISPVIYNYGNARLELAVHMEQGEGLCSPGSATTTAFVNITLEPESSQFVSFSAVPMVTGLIPIKIRLYDIENESGIDAVEKLLNVWTEGLEKTEEETRVVKLDGRSTKTFTIDGTLPDDTVPGTSSNIFISMEGNGVSSFHVKNLLFPEKVAKMIVLPRGCQEQTMSKLVPTVLALRYLDLSEQWFGLPAGTRDDALDKIEDGYLWFKTKLTKRFGSYGVFTSVPDSHWMTAHVVKVLSMVAERQSVAFGAQGRKARIVPEEEIRIPVRYLLSAQKADGSFSDPHPVLHRALKGKEQNAFMTAFIALALNRSLQFLPTDTRNDAEASISRSTTYLLSSFPELQHPYAVAITAYSLSVCLPKGTDLSTVWIKLQGMATKDKNDCYLWPKDANTNHEKADAITVEASSYALLTAMALGKNEWARQAACWLVTQENYQGGFRSTQDTILALEALSEYELFRSTSPEANIIAEFTTPGKNDFVNLILENKKEKVETDLRKLAGNNIVVHLTGKGEAKLKVAKTYYLLDPSTNCDELSISVTVEGKVKYTAKIEENYEYYDDYENEKEADGRVPRSAIEWFDAHTRNRRDLKYDLISEEAVTYTVCVGHTPSYNLTGMAIADITLLSGFEADTEDLDRLTQPPEQYISLYEVSFGRVLLYFNELFETRDCITFDAIQRVPIGLLQPAPAVFYDYYEPNKKCTVFYSAPQRSKMVSKLCSEDVCQCAERPCHKQKMTFKLTERNRRLTKNDRVKHACSFPIVDYAYIVEVVSLSVKSNFELYKTNVIEILRLHGDVHVSQNSVRVFANRRQCKEKLDLGKEYLIMGKDGSTTDSNGAMQYLLDTNTWVERKPTDEHCKKSAHQSACLGFSEFISDYKINGCRQ
ncbi:Complement C4 Complement C4 beta chain [Channa argus]|uniref:Complement C4 Complement C4 beta chain n=1 Tax=Channa argus TaxID=215402 RepID=A0A6G1PNL4_CHAAH|nr:Complement C4 Complement C4 beta chain [Channa argus]